MYFIKDTVTLYKDKFISESNIVDQTLFVVVFVSSIFINKYVLSVLNFTYPTIFQGWQTLVGVIVLKIFVVLTNAKNWQVSILDRRGFFMLAPHFLFYVSSLVAGSKALAKLPVAVFASVGGLPGSSIFLLDHIQDHSSPASHAQVFSAALTFITAVLVLLLDRQLEEETVFETVNSPYYWALIYVVCITAQQLYARISDQKYSALDKLYYGNLFSVVLLAPASIYLEEAFQALHFENGQQTLFHASCLLSGLLAISVGLLHCRQSADQTLDLSRGRALAGLISFLIPVFRIPDSALVKWIIVINLSLGLLIPFKITENSLSRPTSLSNIHNIHKNLLVI